jgi:hypothetical protein
MGNLSAGENGQVVWVASAHVLADDEGYCTGIVLVET